MFCRYSAKGMPIAPTCGHRGKLMCSIVRMVDLQRFHKSFYEVPSKAQQDTFLCKYVKKVKPKPTNDNEPSVRTMSLKFYIENIVGKLLRVCRQTFINALGITKHRVLGIYRNFKKTENSLIPQETRGGWRKEDIYKSKRDSVINFIRQLKGLESHYSRGKSKRLYLPSELNISKLSIIYNSSVEKQFIVKPSYFRTIFNTKFNASFKTPSSDECSTCIEFSSKIKSAKDEGIKNQLKFAKTFHKKKAKCFFDHLNKKPDKCFLLSFDCQKNLQLPKVSDQAAYYSRQLYCYNLTVVTGLSTGELNPETVSIYTWTENQAKKSSNEVASIVFNELNSKDLQHYNEVRLVADGCSGQNKNINVITMCATWLLKHAPAHINSVELVFPVTGHSFMPSDRVFGLIEKKLKKMTTIINVSEYHDIFRSHGTVKEIAKDWVPLDWKAEATKFIKSASQLHFQISQCKKIMLKKSIKNRSRILIKGEIAYNVETGVFKFLEKKKKTVSMVQPKEILIGVPVNKNKIQDVNNLLKKHFGKDWNQIESLEWYKRIVLDEGTTEVDDSCECLASDFVEDEEIYCTTEKLQ